LDLVKPAQHLSPELFFGYEHHLLSPQEVQSAHEHIARCEVCRQELARRTDVPGMESDFRSALGDVHRDRPWRSFRPFAAAASILLIAGASIWFVRRATQPEPVREALRAERIPLPPFVSELNPRREILMGNAGGPTAALLSPKGTAVLSPRPAFRWGALPGQWTYRVRVFAPGMELAAESPELSGPAWTPDRDFVSGVTYEWQVAAVRDGQHLTLPSPPDTPPRFRVIEAATVERLHRLASERHPSHLFLAVEYGRVGLLEDARREMNLAMGENPADLALRKLLESLSPPQR
jgi:hypothetical protein